jgi:predicted RNA-binding protein (virulence factor B family)
VPASIDELLGRTVTLTVRRFGPAGAFLAVDPNEEQTILLPGAQVPKSAKEGDEISVFVHKDSDDRPIATIEQPRLSLDEVAFLKVVDVTRIGAFVDWGLPKQLLVPFREQTQTPEVGRSYAVGLFLDSTNRLAGTMRVSEMLRGKPEVARGDWLEGEVWRFDPRIGTFVIIRRKFVGLVPKGEPHTLSVGAAVRVRVTNVLPDGKVELSLRGLAHEELEADAERILAKLRTTGAPKIGDASTPEQIRVMFGLSKKAFKRAVGRLLAAGHVTIDAGGFLTPKE